MSLAKKFSRERMGELIRFYEAAAINTAFGVGFYLLLIYAGLEMYMAQLISHFTGVIFNYAVYSRHVFRGSRAAKTRFACSYLVNYFASLAVLAGLAQFIASPYIAGIATALIVSLGNYLVLKRFVFGQQPV